MNVKLVLAILSTLAGGAGAMMLLGLFLAGAANTKPEDWPMIRALLWGTALGGLVCFGGAIALMSVGRPIIATALGGLPMAVCLGIMIWASIPR